MAYVVKIQFDGRKPDYKVFQNSMDARQRHMTAFQYERSELLFTLEDGTKFIVTACHSYKVDTSDPREAVRRVMSGTVKSFSWAALPGMPSELTWELVFGWDQEKKAAKKSPS